MNKTSVAYVKILNGPDISTIEFQRKMKNVGKNNV